MIVAIIDETSPSGVVRVRVFREAVDEAAAVDDFVNSYTPPKDPADWLGFDTGWSSYQKAAAGKFWGYDFDTPGLVQINQAERIEVCDILMLDTDEMAITADGSWQQLYRFVINPSAFCDPDFFILRFRFEYRSTGGNPKLRVTENGVGWGQEMLIDQGGWVTEMVKVAGDPPSGMNAYVLQGDRNGASLFELRGVTVELAHRTD